jgi:hypothetical protein
MWIKWVLQNIKWLTLIVAIILLGMSIRTCTRIGNYKDTISRLEGNVIARDIAMVQMVNDYGDTITSMQITELTKNELLNSNNIKINELTNKVKQQGVKIKNLEYQLGIELGFESDTVVVISIDTIDRTIVQYVDSIFIGDFKLIRKQDVDVLKSKYSITYTPILYISISHYKEGKWKLRNLFHKRDIRYKVSVSSSDNMLKPKDITIIKVN